MKQKTYGIHQRKDCGAQYDVQYTDGSAVPYLVCTGCGHEVRDWIKWHEEYRDVWRDDSRWDEPTDAIVCVLGYFCDQYAQHYGFEYVLSLGPSGLFRGAEGVFTRRILHEFNGSARAARQYIDWFFKTKIEARKKKITSMSVLAVGATISQYKHAAKAAKVVNRNTPLPAVMTEWMKQNTPSVLQMAQLDDYGDLQTFLTILRGRQLDGELAQFVAQLQSVKRIDENLNIRGFANDKDNA